ncbi:MAG: hypothetical protein Q7V88_02990 [Actinomycetota bacterium]|nr:hypothetical protein [Actinomycetota bacterium]
MKSRLVRANLIGTSAFLLALAVAIPFREDRPAQVLIAAVSLVLFAIGIATGLWAYTTALELSREREVGVANLYLLTGPTAPKPVKVRMSGALAVQVVAALVGASVGVAGLQESQLNALAFGVLVPMFGIGMNGAWAARYGSYGPRINPTAKPSNRKIG